MDGDVPTHASALDVSDLRKRSLIERLLESLRRPSVYRFMQRWFPIVPGKIAWVWRYDDVVELLSREQVFQVDGRRIREANSVRGQDGPNFLPGMQDDVRCPFHSVVAGPRSRRREGPPWGYRDYQDLSMRMFKLEDLPAVGDLVERWVSRELSSLPADTTGVVQFDVIERLISAVSIVLCEHYCGLRITDSKDFANCALVANRWLFDPPVGSELRDAGRAASERLNRVIDAAIDAALADSRAPGRDTIIDRALDEGIDRTIVRVLVFGMVVLLVPFCTMAGGHILEALLSRREFLQRAQAAARPGASDQELERCLFEALRFMPLWREPLRVVAQPYTLAEGRWYQRRFEVGQRVVAFTAAAMMDPRRVPAPDEFQPLRAADNSLVFGYGMHRCVGAPLAQMHITRALKPLLNRRNLRRAPGKAGRLVRMASFPEHLSVCFDA